MVATVLTLVRPAAVAVATPAPAPLLDVIVCGNNILFDGCVPKAFLKNLLQLAADTGATLTCSNPP